MASAGLVLALLVSEPLAKKAGTAAGYASGTAEFKHNCVCSGARLRALRTVVHQRGAPQMQRPFGAAVLA